MNTFFIKRKHAGLEFSDFSETFQSPKFKTMVSTLVFKDSVQLLMTGGAVEECVIHWHAHVDTHAHHKHGDVMHNQSYLSISRLYIQYGPLQWEEMCIMSLTRSRPVYVSLCCRQGRNNMGACCKVSGLSER